MAPLEAGVWFPSAVVAPEWFQIPTVHYVFNNLDSICIQYLTGCRCDLMTFLDTEPHKQNLKFTELQLLGQKLGAVAHNSNRRTR